MSSSQLFSGSWMIQVFSKDADFSERFVISGSLASDGAFPGEAGTGAVFVSGPRWLLRFEWNDNAGSGWQPSDLRRVGALFNLGQGLTTLLGADDNFPQLRDHDFNDLVLRCQRLDSKLTVHPIVLPDFTLPDSLRNPPDPTRAPGKD